MTERIRGELLKLGIKVSKRTIQKYMRGVRGRRGGGQSWATFVKNHAERMWACDFIQTQISCFAPEIWQMSAERGVRLNFRSMRDGLGGGRSYLMHRWMVMAALCAACSASDPTPIPLENFFARSLQARCEFQVKCGGAADMDACAAYLTTGTLSATELAGLQASRIQYDGEQARGCVDAVAARSCEKTTASYQLTPAACLQVFRGSLHAGAPCADSMECISQNCIKPSCQEACCAGTCQGDDPPALAKIGESCAFIDCAQGGSCDATQTCVPAKRSGESCDVDALLPCSDGLACLSSSKRCGPLPGLGERCNDDGCRDLYAHCSPTTGTCVMEGVLGDPCTFGQADQCTLLYVCSPDQTCSAGHPLGAPCIASYDRCAGPGAFCDIADNATMGVCTMPKPDGAPCQQNFHCASNVCDPASKTCVADVPCD